MNIIVLIIATVISGYADSRGFIYASKIWTGSSINYIAILKSGAGFGVGIFFYWIALKYLKEFNLAISSEVQTLGWFVVTIIGVAITSGAFLQWGYVDKIISLIIIAGFVYCLYEVTKYKREG